MSTSQLVFNEHILSVVERFGDFMPGGFFIYRADGKEELLYANQALCSIYGCSSLAEFKELSGFTLRGMIHSEDYERVSLYIKGQRSGKESEVDHMVYRILRRDGQVRWVEEHRRYVEYEGYKDLYCVFVSDITDKHQKRESDKALRWAVIEALTRSYDSVWLIHDLETQHFELFRIDDKLVHLLPANKAIKLERFYDAFLFYSQLVLEEDRESFLTSVKPEVILQNTQNQILYSVPFRRVFECGIRYYRVEFTRMELPGGQVGIVTGFRDVDEEVQKDKKLQHSLSLRAAVIEALTQSYDSVWLIHDVQTQRFELFRIDEDMVHLLPAHKAIKLERFYDAFTFYSNLVLEEDRQGFLEAVTPESIVKNTKDRAIYSVPFRRVFSTGIRYYRVEFARLCLEDGETDIVVGFKNVDEEVRKDQQIHQALREAIEVANASNRAKSEFLSSMSHDMRTPMNGIIGMTAIAANNLDDRDRVADCLQKISASSRHLLSLINDILDMNKIESGKVELLEESFCLADLIDQTLTMTRPQIQAHKHSFEVNTINVEHEQLIGDSRRIGQVFVNIMSNAIKYTPDGGRISLTVRENPTAKEGVGYYQFLFEDNGYGMTPEFLSHLFEPFARAQDKKTQGIQGTGLGMAITQNIVRMMGGNISVESVYGEGSRFTVTMYLKLQDTVKPQDERFKGRCVLVADSDPGALQSACETLSGMGMVAEGAISSREALEKIRGKIEKGEEYFAILFAWRLPDQEGADTISQMREMVGDALPIIPVSAYGWMDFEQEAREAGATAFISKPLFCTKLSSLFSSLMEPLEDTKQSTPLQGLEEMSLSGHRVLLAEDLEINAEIAINFMEMTGLEVDWARDGKEAVEKLGESPDGYYSILFMDVQMPNMNGYEATRAIRAMERPYAKDIPIIAMTANAFAEDILNCKKAGMNDHLTKPIDVNMLTRMLATYIK